MKCLFVLLCLLGPAGFHARAQSPDAFAVPLPGSALHPGSIDARTRKLMRSYHAALVTWDDIVLEQLRPVPGRPGCAFYGEDGNEENQIRPIAYAALLNAFLSAAHGAGQDLPSRRRDRMREHAVAALHYLARSHAANGGQCANGKPWGNQWQSAMWAYAAGLAGWLIWDRLPADLRRDLSRVVESEANRFLDRPPKSSQARDTGAEENAWNAQILSLAANLMPGHPRGRDWDRAARVWMYNSLSAARDSQDSTPGDDAVAISSWVRTTNVNADFTIENHGLVHVGYLKTSLSLLLENALPYTLRGAPVPGACRHHASDCFDVLLGCMAWDASAIYHGGNDWKLVHTQPTDVGIYALMSVLAGDERAARLEEVALGWVRRIQRVEHGYFNVRRDLEWGGACAIRMITAWLVHGQRGPGAVPLTDSQLRAELTGVRVFESGKAILHRRPDSFASFSWGARRLALTLPENGTWVIWPHFGGYLGCFNQQDGSAANARLIDFRKEIGKDSFAVSGELDRTAAATRQGFAFLSTAEGVTIYVERIRVREGAADVMRETGIIGLEYGLGKNSRRLHVEGQTVRTVGVGGADSRAVRLRSHWLNIDDRIGYVICRLPGKQNILTFHDEAKGSGRVPKLQEWISLVGDEDACGYGGGEDWSCVITFPNQSHRETRNRAGRVKFLVAPGKATVDYNGTPLEIRLPGDAGI